MMFFRAAVFLALNLGVVSGSNATGSNGTQVGGSPNATTSDPTVTTNGSSNGSNDNSSSGVGTTAGAFEQGAPLAAAAVSVMAYLSSQ